MRERKVMLHCIACRHGQVQELASAHAKAGDVALGACPGMGRSVRHALARQLAASERACCHGCMGCYCSPIFFQVTSLRQ